MKNFVQFKTTNTEGTMIDAAGSDGVFILDARNNLETMISDANKQMKRLSGVKKYKYFEIHRGDFKHSRVIFKNY